MRRPSADSCINLIKIDSGESITELGRMLGGVKVTNTVLKSAKEMKDLAVATKNSQSENNR